MRENGGIINVSSRFGTTMLQEASQTLKEKYTSSTLTTDQLDQLVECFISAIETNTQEHPKCNPQLECLEYSVTPGLVANQVFDIWRIDETKNPEIIKALGWTSTVHAGGGLRSLNDLEDIFKLGTRRCIMTSAEDLLIEKIAKDRLTIEMSINEQNELLIHSRRMNTHLNIITRIQQLIELGVQVISITFVLTEGQLSEIPRQQIREFLLLIPYRIEKIYIGRGINTLDDLEYL